MNKKLLLATAGTLLLIAPLAAMGTAPSPYAGPTPVPNPGVDINALITLVLDIVWVVFGAFAVIMFIFAGVGFITAQGDPEKVGVARNFVIYGIIGVVIALLAFSIPLILRTTLTSGGVAL